MTFVSYWKKLNYLQCMYFNNQFDWCWSTAPSHSIFFFFYVGLVLQFLIINYYLLIL